jgi:predicted DNA-binding transcriptional regulator AlpA
MRDASLIPTVLIDAAEFARMLSVSKPTIWRMRDDGKLPSAITLTSQCIRWRREDVLSWIDAGCRSVSNGSLPGGTGDGL